MAWTNPRTWTPGELVTALMMNQHVRDNLNILKTCLNDLGHIAPPVATELTISGGAIVPVQNVHKIDTEADAASDELDTITNTNTREGQLLILTPENAARVVTVRDGVGNIQLRNSNYQMNHAQDAIALRRVGTEWWEVFRSVGGASVTAALIAEGRLTLTSGLAVTTSDVSAAGTLYYTPYVGNRIALYDGASWVTQIFTERSLALSITSATNYDIFIFDNAGTLTLEAVAWTNDTTRATALVRQDGVWVKSGSTTRRYLGTIRASGSNVTEDSFAKRFVWNAYHRVARPMRVLEATNSWSYAVATWRQANANTANQLDVVVGLAEEGIEVNAIVTLSNAATGETARVGIGENSTTAIATGSIATRYNSTPDRLFMFGAFLRTIPAIGRQFYTWLEMGSAGGATVFYGDNNEPTNLQSGVFGKWRA